MKDSYVIFNKLILFTAEAYISGAAKDNMQMDSIHYKIMSGVRAYMSMGRFSRDEMMYLQTLSEDPELKSITQQNIAFLVMSLELMKLWVNEVPKEFRKHIYLGVSDKRLNIGRANYAIGMLKTKQQDPERYKDLKEMIVHSSITAKRFFAYHHRKIIEERGYENYKISL